MNHPASSRDLPQSQTPRLSVVAIGNAGAKIVGPFLSAQMDHAAIHVADTDSRVLSRIRDEQTIRLGPRATDGLGTGGDLELGRKAAEQARDEIVNKLGEAGIVLFVAGLGGGTGTGALPVIAGAVREQGAFTIALVTTPFDFEGRQRRLCAEQGIRDLENDVDVLIVISNQRLLEAVTRTTALADALRMVDSAFGSCMKMVGNLLEGERLLDLNCGDLRRVMTGAGQVVMAYGEGSGDARVANAIDAFREGSAFGLEYMGNVRRVLVHVSGGPDLSVYDVEEAALRIRKMAHQDADIRIGASRDAACGNRIRISVFGIAPSAQSDEASPSFVPDIATVNRVSGSNAAPNPRAADDLVSAQSVDDGRSAIETVEPDAIRSSENAATLQASEQKGRIQERYAQTLPAVENPTAPAARASRKPFLVAVVGPLKGTGTTTLVRHLAHQAQIAEAGPSIIVEVRSAKGSRQDNAERRNEIAGVPIFESSFDQLESDLERLKDRDATHIFVDASAGTREELDRAIAVVDAVLIPTRPVEQQVEAIGPIVASAERHARPFVMIINCAKKSDSANARVAMALAQHGVVCSVIVPRSEAITAASAENRTVMEIDPEGAEAVCFARLWDYLATRLKVKLQAVSNVQEDNVAGKERRRFQRWDLRWPVKVTCEGHTFDAMVGNVSGGGVLLEGVSHLSAGQWVRLEVENLDTFEAEVVHTKENYAGLRFLLEGARQYELAERLALLVEQAKNQPIRRRQAASLARRA